MKNKNAWITVSLINLAIVAALGLAMRTKFLFPVPFLNYRNLLSAHSHFAFGGWVTLVLAVLFIDSFLQPSQQQKKAYRVLLWGILLNSFGMVLSFPFEGYGIVSIIFSTLFIFFTYGFTWVFIADVRRNNLPAPIPLLAIGALSCLVISSAGPFSLAYMMATHSGSGIRVRDSVYFFLHFQYNGFFTLSVFALLFNRKINLLTIQALRKVKLFAIGLCLSVPPSLFLSLLWHHYNIYLRATAFIGCGLILVTLFYFFMIGKLKEKVFIYESPLARNLLMLSMISFTMKMILQTGTIIPSLGNAVFGFRPIIIGFLHLVFLGLVTLFILSRFIEDGYFSLKLKISKFAIVYFVVMVILNEAILFTDGLGRLFRFTHPIYDQLVWIVAIGLFTASMLLVIARVKSLSVRNSRNDRY